MVTYRSNSYKAVTNSYIFSMAALLTTTNQGLAYDDKRPENCRAFRNFVVNDI